MKKRNLKSLKINKQLISRVNNTSVVGGGGKQPEPSSSYIIECITRECPTESQDTGCYTMDPFNNCIAPPNP